VEIFLSVLFVIYSIAVILWVMNDFLPLPRWACDRLGWHLMPKELSSDGFNVIGKCPRCGKKIMQDSQGNWF